jgi:hypothetical protein
MEVIAEATQPDSGVELKECPTTGTTSVSADPLLGVIRQRLGLPQESPIVAATNALSSQDTVVVDNIVEDEILEELIDEVTEEIIEEEVNEDDIDIEDDVDEEELKDTSRDASSSSELPPNQENSARKTKNNNTNRNNKQNAQSIKSKKAAAAAAAAAAAKKQAEERKQQERARYNKVSWSVCDGQNCKGCWEFVTSGNAIGNPCKNCGCLMISHIPAGDDVDTDFAEEDYISEYGGEESW